MMEKLPRQVYTGEFRQQAVELVTREDFRQQPFGTIECAHMFSSPDLVSLHSQPSRMAD
jgi:hypothetical protein